MTINELKQKYAVKKAGADIVQRWADRMESTGWAQRGESGAAAYLANYGKGISAKKVAALASYAESLGFAPVAARFWSEAYRLETGMDLPNGESLSASGSTGVAAPVLPKPATASPTPVFRLKPQLLIAVDLAEAERLLDSPQYGMQEKMDGERHPIEIVGGVVIGGNKRGLVRPVLPEVADELRFLGDAVLDGEIVGVTYHVFDILSHGGKDLRHLPFQSRYAILERLIASISYLHKRVGPPNVAIVPLVTLPQAKKIFSKALYAEGAEGYVLKLLSAGYTAGAGHFEQFKFQFRSTIAAVVGEKSDDRRSVSISVLRDTDGSRRELGKVTIPGARNIPEAGSIIEVEYLYCHSGKEGKLAQPVYKGVRFDAVEADCLESKLRVVPADYAESLLEEVEFGA
jgi:bifunctional non-homologous end joining protein LigD